MSESYIKKNNPDSSDSEMLIEQKEVKIWNKCHMCIQ